MSNDIYNPPTAPLAELGTESSQPEFYVVSKRKFLTMYLTTLGFYSIYWFYRNWKLQKRATALDVIPLLRTTFQVFFYHSLFRRVDHRLRSNQKKFYWSPNAYATAIVVLSIISNGIDRVSLTLENELWPQFLSLAILPVLAFAYLPAQEAINQCCNDPKGNTNNTLTTGNFAWMGFGALLWAITIYSMVEPSAQAG